MAIRNIVKQGDPILNKVCREVSAFDEKLSILIDDMIETMRKANGVGLAAPQVGVLKRVVIVDAGDGLVELINPQIIKKSGNQEEIEGCLSCPGEWGITKRPKKVKVKAFDRYGKEFTIEGEDLKAVAFCHEIDHLDGILFKKHVIRMLDRSEIEM